MCYHQEVVTTMIVFSYCLRLLFHACYLSFTIANVQNQPVLRRVLLATEVIIVREGNGSSRTIVILIIQIPHPLAFEHVFTIGYSK